MTYPHQSPQAILDAREVQLLRTLTEEYQSLLKPGSLRQLLRQVADHLPEGLKAGASKVGARAMEAKLVAKALEHAGRGFAELNNRVAGIGLSKSSVVQRLVSSGIECDVFEEIGAQRSYSLQSVVSRNQWKHLTQTIVEGAATGAPGAWGLPFNMALSMLLYFRAVQSIALHYGYDVHDDPRELQIAADVTLFCFAPGRVASGDTVAGMIGKVMLAANLSALEHALATKTLQSMARHGGSQLLYVQMRALGHAAAKKALATAGAKGLENTLFRDLLAVVGRRIPMEGAKKGIPAVGAVVGALSDTYYMSRVLRIANLCYHKRFLFEKEERVARLKDGAV